MYTRTCFKKYVVFGYLKERIRPTLTTTKSNLNIRIVILSLVIIDSFSFVL